MQNKDNVKIKLMKIKWWDHIVKIIILNVSPFQISNIMLNLALLVHLNRSGDLQLKLMLFGLNDSVKSLQKNIVKV